MIKKTIRVFEAFAGYGGASFGLKRSKLKYKVVGMSEFDPFASALLEANFPNIKNWGDITKINSEELPDFDLFTGGFPCQPFSSAGLQNGEEDKYGRGTLFYDIFRILQEKRPKYVLLENVKGLTAKKFEQTFNRIKDLFRELGYGEMAYAVLNSKDYGIPQNRERLWMFAQLGGLPEDFDICPPKVKLKYTFADFLYPDDIDDSLRLSDAQIAHLKVKHKIESFDIPEPLCLDIYNKKIKQDKLCITITQPEHNSLRVIEPVKDGKERVRKMSVEEQFHFMGFKKGELNFAGQSYSQLSKRAGNGWDVNLVGILLNHIFKQL
jgi:DNA (cytosine-5)-methyltransferase 1